MNGDDACFRKYNGLYYRTKHSIFQSELWTAAMQSRIA
jgi:hypothetical protein